MGASGVRGVVQLGMFFAASVAFVWSLGVLARACERPGDVAETREAARVEAGAPQLARVPGARARDVRVAVPAGPRPGGGASGLGGGGMDWERRVVRVSADDVASLGGEVAAAVTVALRPGSPSTPLKSGGQADTAGQAVATVLVGSARPVWFPDASLRHRVPVRVVGDTGRALVAVVAQRRAVVDLRPSAVVGVDLDRGGRMSPVGGVLAGRVWMVRPGVVVAWRSGSRAARQDSAQATASRLAVRAVALVEVRERLGVGVTWAPGVPLGVAVSYQF